MDYSTGISFLFPEFQYHTSYPIQLIIIDTQLYNTHTNMHKVHSVQCTLQITLRVSAGVTVA